MIAPICSVHSQTLWRQRTAWLYNSNYLLLKFNPLRCQQTRKHLPSPRQHAYRSRRHHP
jgi:hypothetical protein